ncbi:hypothetical protein HOE67_03825 [Candidatus Peregrinibacteria bacterium]|jgi:peptidoglycan hydrolase-like protein with peptidoglycan-binding domain/3D (Asp-Asp-Asp) domain-containing protein|nr:hypothetical protein [Candidatus Peregrinibacteria bacterium]MBT4056215.1 hypothetical protein [Candidatus Peregrinibacteria bacterium]
MKNITKSLLTIATISTYFFNFSLVDVPVQARIIRDNVAYAKVSEYPYEHTFIITAYYSPLPGQLHYVTGSYQGDIRLNGRGTNGADGTPVFPGMIAAPKKYNFGTKMQIPGLGMTSVHDRGGAIVQAGERNMAHDRLDVWLGYGDNGLSRALNWGVRTVNVTIHGIDNNIVEQVSIPGYSSGEKESQDYYYIPEYYEAKTPERTRLFKEDLWYLDDSDDVEELQKYLKQLGYYEGKADGYFGDETRMAIYLFQKDKGLVQSIADLGAGHFGSQTRESLEDVIFNRKEDLSPKINLGPDDTDADNITKLQKLLKVAGYTVKESGSYDTSTSNAVYAFQKDNNIVSNKLALGAGYFGPKTSAALSKKLNDLLKAGKVAIPVAHASEEVEKLVENRAVLTPFMHETLSRGTKGPEVTRLQTELASINLYRKTPNGSYDGVTEHAVFKFQQIHGIVAKKDDQGAGVFGPQTRDTMNDILSSKNYYNKKIAEKRVAKN